jgi:replicative DNA helicase
MNAQPPLLGLSLRQPPANQLAEQALLGAILANNKSFERVASFLLPQHFADELHGWIFSECAKRISAGRLVDAVTLQAELQNSPRWELLGATPEYVPQLLGALIGIIGAREYGLAIYDAWRRRELISVAESLASQALGSEGSLDTIAIAAEAIAKIDAATSGSPSLVGAITLDHAMDSALEAMEKARDQPSGIATGFRVIDERIGGLEDGMVYVLAGRPGMGKSALGHQIALNAARAGVGVLELSLEMSAQQLGRRTLSTAAQVPIMAMKRGRLNMADGEAVVIARRELSGLPLTIDDAGGQTAAMIAAKAREAHRKHGLGLIMVDHLNLMRAEEQDAKHGGTWAIERASATMLQLAKDCACPVLLLAQLNRGVEARDDKRPNLSDLRQAGAIEQDAYAVGFVYRPEYYLGGEPEPKVGLTPARLDQQRQEWREQRDTLRGRAELIWAKVRDGEPGTDNLTFDGPTATFGEIGDD